MEWPIGQKNCGNSSPKGKADAAMAALSMSNFADVEHALSAPLTNADAQSW
jgi:hypothetical protein